MSFDKNSLKAFRQRQEPVELDGGTVWVREELVAEHMEKLQLAQRPSIDPRGGVDIGAAVAWQILFALYQDDAPGAGRVFDETEIGLIYRFRRQEFERIMAAIARVNGESEAEQAAWEDFTRAGEAATPSH